MNEMFLALCVSIVGGACVVACVDAAVMVAAPWYRRGDKWAWVAAVIRKAVR